MNNIKIVEETACVMFLDNEGNYKDSFFINQYYFQLINKKQKEALKTALLRENRDFQELWLKDDDTLYLTYIDTNNDNQLVDVIYNDGMRQVKYAIDVLEYMDNHEFNILHDFWETKKRKNNAV